MTFHNGKILIKPIVNKNRNKYYYDIFLGKGSCKDKLIFVCHKCDTMIDLTFLKELMLLKQEHQKSETICICHYCYFLNSGFTFQPNVSNRCHDLLMMSINLSNIAILNIKSSDYRCAISLISKNEAIKLM